MNDSETQNSECRGCDGTGYQPIPRQFLSFETGEISTVWSKTRCRHCRDNPVPGRQRGYGPPV